MAGVRNYHVKAAVCKEKKQITFLYDVKKGHADQSYGVQVAQFAGLPEAITTRAAAMSQHLECAEKREKRRSKGILDEADRDRDGALKKLRAVVTHAFAAETPQQFLQRVKDSADELREGLKEVQKQTQLQVAAA